ncbi:Serine/threonine protein kinase [Streptomyces zhaozhouensis]|uniref:Serine/threonine protein kinase n=2 Tax=Streptomyces zhaozhouensis TaxID=1300267 RepID=A0A286DTQ0_9ACTN|nr:Serine/threonine protein kinase [Streptomyces zhaozhouensis]
MSLTERSDAGPLAADDPERIGPYRLLGRLGTGGGLGQLYLGQGPDARLLAVRAISHRFAADPAFVDRLRAALTAAENIEGTRVVPVHDADLDGPAPWLASAFHDAHSLARIVRQRGPLTPEAGWQAVVELTAALASAHAAGVPHGALRPSNVLLTPDGLRLTDIGIAHARHPGGPGGAPDEAALGDPDYLCPESVLGEPAGPAADLYALGAVLHFATTGRTPFGFDTGQGRTSAFERATAYQRIVRETPDLSAVQDPGLRALIAECLAKEPAERPTAAALLARLEPAAESPPPLPATPPPPAGAPATPPAGAALPTVPAPPAAPPPPPTPPTASSGRRPIRRTWFVGVAGVLSLALVATLVLLLGDSDDSSTTASPGDRGGEGEQRAPGSDRDAAAGTFGFDWGLTVADVVDTDDDFGDFVGLWSTESSVVVGTSHGGLAAVDPATGERLWTWRTPEDGRLCNMTPGTSDGVGAVAYESARGTAGTMERCDRLQTIDLTTGEARWAEPTPLRDEGMTGAPTPLNGQALSIGDGFVTAPYGEGDPDQDIDFGPTDLLVADLATGETRWRTAYDGAPEADGCALVGEALAMRDRVYAVGACDGAEVPQLLSLDGESGAPARSAELTGCVHSTDVPTSALLTTNGDHLVVGCQPLTGEAVLHTLSADTGALLPITVGPFAERQLNEDFATVSPPDSVLLRGDTLYLPQAPGDDVAGATSDGVVAVDLTDGTELWRVFRSGAERVRLLGGTETEVEILADGEQLPATVYTENETATPSHRTTLDETQRALLENTGPEVLSARIGDRLVLAFTGASSPQDPVLTMLDTGGADPG